MTGRDLSFAVAGAIAAILLLAIVGTAIASFGLYNVAADVSHTGLVSAGLEYTRAHSITARARGIKAPRLDSPEMIADGASDYDEMCKGCHLAPGVGENEMRPGMNPKPPLLAQGPAGDPRELFWAVKHGIKMTGMPAWGVTHSDEEIWNIVAVLAQLPRMSPAEYRTLVAKSSGHHEHEMGEHDQMEHHH